MNCFTMGWVVDLTSATEPVNTILPRLSMAMRSATLKALGMSWVTTMLVTPSSRCSLMIRSLMASLVMGSRPVVGSS